MTTKRSLPTMAEIAAKVAADKTPPVSTSSRGASFPFWSIPVGSSALVRFLPDADETNMFPYVEKRTIKLAFSGSVGGEYPTTNSVTVTVPCMESFGKKCYITEAIRPLWKGSEDEKQLARQYYRKPSFIYSGFVVASPLAEETPPENPIRLFHLNRSIHDAILSALSEPGNFEEVPWDLAAGRDFRISKTQRGEYANYATSSFTFKNRPLSEMELAAIETHGLRRLADELGPEPDESVQTAIREMYHASLAGQPFDASRWPMFRAYEDKHASAASPSKPGMIRPPAQAEADHILSAIRFKTATAR